MAKEEEEDGSRKAERGLMVLGCRERREEEREEEEKEEEEDKGETEWGERVRCAFVIVDTMNEK